MNGRELLARVNDGDTGLVFQDVLAAIDGDWAFTPVPFRNGTVENGAGENAGSCKVLAFAAAHRLSEEQTLLL
ncbi:MAG: HopJ type III effector protein, partial [Alcanivoracaceae bacterium]